MNSNFYSIQTNWKCCNLTVLSRLVPDTTRIRRKKEDEENSMIKEDEEKSKLRKEDGEE